MSISRATTRTGSSRQAKSAPGARPLRILVTAGPTQEPIDSVRYLGNRSSGRVGIAIADAAARGGHRVRLLLGPASATPSDSRVSVERFRTSAELQALLHKRFASCDLLIMAAAVADYRPVIDPAAVRASGGKFRRQASGLTLTLKPTPDLLAGLKPHKRAGQRVVGFALEPAERLLASAQEKLARKGLDAIVANELRTMNAPDIQATVIFADGAAESTPGPISKSRFGRWLLRQLRVPVTPR